MGRTASIGNATLCGDRACRRRGMQVKLRFLECARNLLRTSCVLEAQNAGEMAFLHIPARPPAERCGMQVKICFLRIPACVFCML